MSRWMVWMAAVFLGAEAVGAVEIQHWMGSLSASLWDPAYKKGLGGLAGAESHVPIEATVASLELGYSFYQARYVGTDDVHEVFGTLGLKHEFHPFPDEILFPRLGIHAGVSSNYKNSLHALAGFNVDGVIPVHKGWSILLAFEPSYSMGENQRFFWRAALGILVDAKP